MLRNEEELLRKWCKMARASVTATAHLIMWTISLYNQV